MAKSAASGPASFAEGLRGIAQAVTDAMTTADAAPHMAALLDMQKLVVSMIQHVSTPQAPPAPGGAPGGPPAGGPPPGGPGMMAPGGGTNLSRLSGTPAPGPSAAGGGGPSLSGASADDVRRLVAQS